MRAQEFIREDAPEGLVIKHKATPTGGAAVEAYIGNREVGFVQFQRLRDGNYKASMAHVSPSMRKQGIGREMYRYARNVLGFNVVPSDSQSDDARAFWAQGGATNEGQGVAEGQRDVGEALVHRGYTQSTDPNDVWNVRDDNSRRLRHRRNEVILAQAAPKIEQRAKVAYQPTTTDGSGQRYRPEAGSHYAYIQGRMTRGLPQGLDAGRPLKFDGRKFMYADSGEIFAGADYVHFTSDRRVIAYNSAKPIPAAGPEVSVGVTVAEGSKKITELRDRMFQYIKSIVPTWPDYVVKDWLYAARGKGNTSNDGIPIKDDILELLADSGVSPATKWQLIPNVKFTMDMFEPSTREKLIGRAGGKSDLGMGVPRDAERHATQAQLAKQQGGVSREPVILIKTAQGYRLVEGWHRTIQHFDKYPNGYTGPAYVAVAQGPTTVAESLRQKLDFDKIYGKYLKVTDNDGDPNKEGFSLVTPLNGASWNWQERPEFKKIVKQNLNRPGWLGDHKYQQIIDAMAGNKFDPVKHLATENFADGKIKGKSRPGRVKRAGASCAGSVTSLRKRAKAASGERAKMYHWCANMKSGKKK